MPVYPALVLGLAAASAADVCPQYQTCHDCLNPRDPALNCGWCTPDPAVTPLGSNLTQCMDHTSRGWVCNHLYMHDGCIPGWVCNQTSGTCHLGNPGEGDTKSNCELGCTTLPPPPDQYTCNVTSFQCEKAPKGSAKGSCSYACSNSTPPDLVGLWRGISVQTNFSVGEHVMNFSQKTVTWGPHGEPTKFAADVAFVAEGQVRLILAAPTSLVGEVLYASFSSPGWPTGPETCSVTIALQRQGAHQAPPRDPSLAMGNTAFDVFVMHSCNEWKPLCDFSSAFRLPAPPPTRAAPRSVEEEYPFIAAARRLTMADDACTANADCGSCIGDPLKTCGWCDGVITFGDGSTCGDDGHGCCGGASGFSKCNVAYRKYCPATCDRSDWHAPKCMEASTQCINDPSCQKFPDCQKVEEWGACNYGLYCNKTSQQCAQAHSQAECALIPECAAAGDPPTCTNCSVAPKPPSPTPPKPTPPSPPTFRYCEPYEGCKTAANKSACEQTPGCDPSTPTCDAGTCAATTFYTCDRASLQCRKQQGKPTPPYYNTSAACDAGCYDNDVSGVWRGLRVDQGFVVDEWDFSFAGGAVTYRSKETGTTLRGTYDIRAPITDGTFASFEIAVTLTTGEKLVGLYDNQDVGPITKFMYLGMPLADGDSATSYDDAMAASKQEFVLVACISRVAACDFSPAAPA